MPRGIDLNNPGNLRIGPSRWTGKVTPSTDATYEQFDTAENGIRALAVLLLNYHRRGYNTPRKIVTRFAPAEDGNPTSAYIAHVCKQCACGPDDIFDLTQYANLDTLVRAIIRFEQGMQPYSGDVLHAALTRARSRA